MSQPNNNDGSEQLYKDVCEVFIYHTKNIHDFPEEYQEVLKNAYRFSAVRYDSKYGKVAKRTTDTLDII